MSSSRSSSGSRTPPMSATEQQNARDAGTDLGASWFRNASNPRELVTHISNLPYPSEAAKQIMLTSAQVEYNRLFAGRGGYVRLGAQRGELWASQSRHAQADARRTQMLANMSMAGVPEEYEETVRQAATNSFNAALARRPATPPPTPAPSQPLRGGNRRHGARPAR